MSTPGWYPDPLGGPGNRYWTGSQWDGIDTDEPVHEFPPEKQQRPRLLVPALILAVGLLAGMLVMALWPKSESPTSSAPSVSYIPPVPTTTTTTTTRTTSAAPTTSRTEEVAAEVRTDMQRTFDTDTDVAELGLKVLDVKLVNKSGNEYKGIATIRAGNGITDDVSVEVTADGDNVLWEIPPGALLFAIPDSQTEAPTVAGPVLGADAQGFFDSPRCIDVAALIMRTALSQIVVCPDDGPAELYEYRGLRLSDRASIALPARRTAGGFVATNPADGTRYQLSREGLAIYSPDGDVYTESATALGP
jgi:hypothetical protein